MLVSVCFVCVCLCVYLFGCMFVLVCSCGCLIRLAQAKGGESLIKSNQEELLMWSEL